MTVQAQESLEYKGEKYNLIGLPFESYLELNKNISMDFHYTTANRRGYQGYWKIENNKLFLTNLKSSYYTFEQLFNSTEPIHADWYSGVLEFGFGNFKPNHWWGTYENYLWLKIEKGNVIEKRIRQGIDEYDYDQFVNFGIHKNQSIKDLIYGKIDSYKNDAIAKYINAIFTSLLDHSKIAIIPNSRIKDKIEKFQIIPNSSVICEVKDNCVMISSDNDEISIKCSQLMEEILSLIFINLNSEYRTQVNLQVREETQILNDSILINSDLNYMNWALINVEHFNYPPQFLNRKFYLKKFVGFKIERLSNTKFSYKIIMLENQEYQFPANTLQINQKKYEDIYNVVFDNKLNETFYNSYAISNCQEFLYFLHEEVAEKYIMLDEDNSDENYDDYEIQSYEDWLNEEFGDDAETAYWNLD